MKVLVALVILMGLGPLASAIFKHLENECAKKHGVNPYLLENSPSSNQVQCYYYCQLEKLEIIANGVINPFDVSVLNVTQENYDRVGELIKPCLKLTPHHPNKCHLGYLVFECLKKHVEELV